MTAHLSPRPVPADPKAAQRAASDPTQSVWVNASAGSGKTTVLTERVTRLLLAGTLPQKILCLTYTRAGAAEMSNRVTALFSKWASCDDDTLRDDLAALQDGAATPGQMIEARRLFARILACPGGLRIRTIHSFCQEILSRFPIEAGLPPHFALIDEQDLEVMRREVLDDMLRDAAEHSDQPIAHALSVLVSAQGEYGFERMLQDAMRERARLAQAGDPARLIEKMRALLLLQPGDTPETLRASAMQALPEAKMRELAAWFTEGGKKNIDRAGTLSGILALPADQRAGAFDDYIDIFLTSDGEPRKGSDLATKALRAAHPDIEDIATHEALRLLSFLERIEAADIAQLTESVLSFGGAFAERLAKRKADRAALDYDDLILLTDRLLNRRGISPWILYKLDNGIDHVLVDEAQDTSRAQWNIVQALTAEFYAGTGARDQTRRTLFVVGDEKQSIFSFQNADPEAFLSLRDFFGQRLADAGKELKRVGLHTSFRSAPAVLNAVNTIFAPAAVRHGVSEEVVTHTAFRNRGVDKIGRVEIWPLIEPAKVEGKSDGTWVVPTGYEDEHDPQAELAQRIARKIKLLTSGETLPGIDRPIAAGDIMILLRRRGRFADLMVRALKTNDVPVTGVDRMKLVAQLPVMDLLAALRFVLLPEDDLNLAALMRGPLLGFGEEQLMELAIGRTGSLWQSLKDHAKNPVFAVARDYLAARLSEADFSTPFAFLSRLLSSPCPANGDSGRKALWARLGHEALDPIDELLNEAQSFGQRRPPSLQNFLHWLTDADAEIKRELDHGGGQVRIMTVHAAKGLEAPIVFLPDTASVPRMQDLPKFQWSADGVPLFLARKPSSGAARDLWRAARERQMQEYRRLFYVALTRAANRLYICGWETGRKEPDADASWYNLAASALRPLHQEHLRAADNSETDIITGDNATAPAPALKSAAAVPVLPVVLPVWISRAAPVLPVHLPVAPPSRTDAVPAATPDAAFARGRIIHRLLQSLPDLEPTKRDSAINRFLSHPRHRLDQPQHDEIAREVSALLNDDTFAHLFSTQSRAEVPLTGRIDGADIFRQVDRLCLSGNEVWIVDYKTNRPPPLTAKDVPDTYRRQLAEYRALLRAIYPDKKVRTFLLWTYAPRLMEIPA